ncbi:MAG: type II secretion system protein [Planctomycetota bacterium]
MRRRSGLTLIEVVVALVLMGSVLVGSLLAFSAHRKQLSIANKQIEATIIAESLVRELSARQSGMPSSERGLVPGYPNWMWQTSIAGQAEVATVNMRVIQFEILDMTDRPLRLVAVNLFVKAVR